MIVHKESSSLLLKLRPEPYNTLRTILPAHTRPIAYDGHNLAVPHNLKIVKILRNMGINAPGPIRYHYNWPKPARFAAIFPHQIETADFLTMHARCFVLNEMGTSKSASACWAADYLMTVREVQRVLIISPLSTLEYVWLNELFDVCMHRTARVLTGDAQKRRDMLAKPADFYIVNPDGLKIIAKDLAARKDIDLVIVDEAADYRNAQTDRYETLEAITKNRRLWMMTGAPCPNAPTDAWALARLVDKSRVTPYFSQFQKQTMHKISQYKWVPQVGSHEAAFKALQPAIRFRKKDCLSLPPVLFSSRACELTADQAKAYEAMKTHLVAEAKAGVTITAANAADKISKLRQILCGAIKTGENSYEVIDHSKRFKVLTDTIDQAAAKVLVIVPFKGIVRALNNELQDWHTQRGDGRRCAMVNGDVSAKDRTRIFEDFRDDPDFTEMVCHPKVMSHGLTFTEADMVLFYAPIYSNDQTGQVMDRINRPGQTRSMSIVRIVANALERGIYAIVESRAESQGAMLALYHKELGLA